MSAHRKRIASACIIAPAIILLALAGTGCKKTAAQGEPPAEAVDESLLVAEGGEGGFVYANAEAVTRAFTLDFRSQTPEPEQLAETLDTAVAVGPAERGGRTADVIPGLRKPGDYRTDYVTERPSASAEMTAVRLTPPRDAGAFTVVDWGPRGFLSAAVRRPSIFVMFSQPVVPLAALGAPSSSSPIVSIDPPVKGSFRWYGTSFLSFEGDEPCRSQQTYTISVSPAAESIYGIRIEGETRFSFETERLSMKAIEPGAQAESASVPPAARLRAQPAGYPVPPEAAKNITISFNYPVRADEMKEYIAIATDAGGAKDFVLTQADETSLFAALRNDVEFDTRLTVTLKRGARSGGGNLGTREAQVLSFRTPGPFVVTGLGRVSAWRTNFNSAVVEFSVPIDTGTALGAVRTEPEMPLTADNVEVWRDTLRLSNLPLDFGAEFKIIVEADLRDVYGRRLGERYELTVTLPPESPHQGYAAFLDSGKKMLEAQFEPRLLFEYENVLKGSGYTLEQKNNPYSKTGQKIDAVELQGFQNNYTYFEEMDLRPYLNSQGRGFVSFSANIKTPGRGIDPDTGKQRIFVEKNSLDLQVTDLGLTVRSAFNKTIVMVTSLSTGEPVEGAAVKLIAPRLIEGEADISAVESFARAVTDKNGFAVIDTPAGVYREAMKSARYSYVPYVFAEKDGDRAVFTPSSHSAWRFGIDSAAPADAERARPVTFMFSDRGVYKPGETLTFRGVDRSLVLGVYAIYSGDYTVKLVKEGYRGETVATVTGTASESGGYYGSIKLDDSLYPGEYRLQYLRDGGDSVCADVPVTVAYFERLKFQASIVAPAADVIAGDDINVTLTASYLSGGSLSGAEWRASWFRELQNFRPGTKETAGFVFGPRNVYDGKRGLSSSRGALSADGKAALSQKTAGDSVEGAAYTYSVEAAVTDLSNQEIARTLPVTVHPALFYIGAARQSKRGFAKAGEEAAFDYITVNPSGRPLANNSQFLGTGENANSMTAELVREEWTRVRQRAVNGYVYDNYERREIVESTQKIAIKTSGSIRARPAKAGFHILRLRSFDRAGRKALTEITFYVTGSGSSYWNMNNSDELRLVPDQAVYNPGDTAEVLLQSSLPAGRYLITVEREGIFTEEVREFDSPVSVLRIPIAQNYVPVVYVSVSSYSVRSGPPAHTYGTPDLDKPKGYYGAAALFVNPRVRAFSVKFESGKKVFRPGEEVTVTLTAERDGKPLPNAELTLMAVDRGVLDLIDYHVPDPIAYFYDKERFPLSVRGGDSRAMLMDPVTYSVKNLYGGDSDSKIEERKDFNPTAVFEPFLLTDENGKVQCTFRLPDTLTTYRVTVFGVRGDLFSLKETEIAARNVINVQQVQPRRLRERDTAEAGVLITNLDSVPHKVNVSLSIGEIDEAEEAGGDDGSGVTPRKGAAFVDGASEHTVTVGSGGNSVVYFDVAAEKRGRVNLVYTIRSDVLNERLVQGLTIEKPYITETVVTTGSLSENRQTEAIVIPGFADDGQGSLAITLDATRLTLLQASVDYLFRYPYGCLEQRSAAVLPLVIFGEYLDVFGLTSEVSDPRKAVQKEMEEWARTQRPDGGFPYWPSGLKSDFYVSLRIAHIAAIAEEKGIKVPVALKSGGFYGYLELEYQKLYRESSRLRREDTGRAAGTGFAEQRRAYLQAYTLYVLALLKRNVDTSRLSELVSVYKDDPATLAFAGMAARNAGRADIAANAAQTLRNLLRPTARGVDLSGGTGDDRFLFAYYGGRTEQLALALQFFVDQFPGDDINTRILYTLLANKRAGGYWNNTAVTSRVLAAVDALIRTENLAKTNVTGTVTLADRELLRASFKGLGAKAAEKTFDFKEFPLAAMPRDSALPLAVTRRGTGSIYWTASLTYALPSEMQTRRDEGIGVFQTVYDAETGSPVEGGQLESGRLYRAEIHVSSSRDRTYLALRAPVPSGAEILDARFVTTGATASDDEGDGRRVSNQAIFDNEVQYFWDTFGKGEAVVRFLFRAARRGVFPTPPVQAECMYEGEIFGRGDGILYTVK